MSEEQIEKTPEMEQIEELMAQLDQKVDAEKYDELETKYKQLLKNYTERRPAPIKVLNDELKPVAEYAAELSRVGNDNASEPLDVTNRAYIQLSVNYRDAYLKETGKDPWTDDGGEPTPLTEKIAKVYKDLLRDFPSPVHFSRELNDIMRDDNKLLQALAAKRAKDAKKIK